ncbi:hypothetical protein BDA96_05G034300 [Sorghum bicolor]|uniref:X8 domain-containing protein n=2 Tax=Sorghum bicolor TaxID=4558 RepID=A0A921QXW9_SORBI|nr:leucine-rich repeat extensin-like protein 5 [Sorghum bicolor]KAG0528696.1 hypothetical protein BDA96_05G034300 [Sorghum bicolor]KXG27714.1 hypothetical protein SORBI_3005G032600 [Sorghum bicolor]|eukprot:XP_021316595.1 leucine-rich repeat extensin-like protein 5 [Sorghum bicolor]
MARPAALLLFLLVLSAFQAGELPRCSAAAAAAAGKPAVLVHDDVSPVQDTNPIATVPSNNPTPTIITVPSTNPTITIPSLNPLPTPITAPSTNTPSPSSTMPPPVPVIYPLPTPSTSFPPTVPVTNPAVTTPSTSPPSTPTPVNNPPVSNPTPTTPAPTVTTPAASGRQVWCVVKPAGSSEAALQNALDYACGIGGTDCSAIQPSGSCYYPNTIQAHASYAFNTYYQRNPVPSSCDFGGTAMLVTANPSSGSCVFASSSPSSSSTAGYDPASTTNPLSSSPGSDSGAPVLNASGAGSSESSDFGFDIPGAVNLGSGWRSASPPNWPWAALVWILVALCVHKEGMT